MYKYMYVECTLGSFFTSANHHELIDEYASKGWRMVQVLPMNYNGEGRPRDYEIIFEKEVEDH